MDLISFLIIAGAVYTGILLNSYMKLTPEQVLTPITGTFSLVVSMLKKPKSKNSTQPNNPTPNKL